MYYITKDHIFSSSLVTKFTTIANSILLLLFLFFCYLLNIEFLSIFFYFLLLTILLYKNRKNRYEIGKYEVFYFIYISLMGIAAMYSYHVFCNNTFSPYFDDSYYYNHITSLLKGKAIDDSTLYEYFVAIFVLPLSLFKNIGHFDMLCFNWLLGAFVVSESLKFANHFYPIKSNNRLILLSLFIITNSNYIIGTVHLYRDILICFLLIKSFNFALDNKPTKSFLFSVLAGFVRGANGVLGLLSVITYRLKGLKKIKLVFLYILLLIVFLISDKYVGYSSYLRTFNSTTDSSQGFTDKIQQRRALFYQESESSGVMSMIQSNNPIIKISAAFVYMVTPIKVSNFVKIDDYVIDQQSTYSVYRFRIESIWELISIIFLSFFIYDIFLAIFYLFKYSNIKEFITLCYFIFTIIAVTYISMQYRHKMVFIILFPFVMNFYWNIKEKYAIKTNYLVKLSVVLIIFIYNLIS